MTQVTKVTDFLYLINASTVVRCLQMQLRVEKSKKKLCTLLDLCVSSLRRGHANLLCIVPILTDDPRRESESTRSLVRRDCGDKLCGASLRVPILEKNPKAEGRHETTVPTHFGAPPRNAFPRLSRSVGKNPKSEGRHETTVPTHFEAPHRQV